MTIFVHAFRMIPAETDQPARLCRLDWVVANDENRLCRGFSFDIEPDNWQMDESTAVIEHGATFNRLHVFGSPAAMVVKKFFNDLDSCDTMVAPDVDAVIAILTTEAKVYLIGAKRKIENRISFPSPDEPLNFEHNVVNGMVERYFNQ